MCCVCCIFRSSNPSNAKSFRTRSCYVFVWVSWVVCLSKAPENDNDFDFTSRPVKRRISSPVCSHTVCSVAQILPGVRQEPDDDDEKDDAREKFAALRAILSILKECPAVEPMVWDYLERSRREDTSPPPRRMGAKPAPGHESGFTAFTV